jgi:hypothetical protein
MVNPSTTVAILLGASAWPKSTDTLPASLAFSNSARDFKSYLLSSDGLALPPSHLLDLFDSEAVPSELLDNISVF